MSNEIVLLRFVGLLFMLAGIYGKFAADVKEHQKKGEQHYLGVLEWTGIALAFVVSFWSNIHPFVTCFALLFIRIGTGNIIYNHVGNYKYSHVGSTDKLFDFWMQKLPNWLVILIYLIFTFGGLMLQFSNFNF
jgi:hypothetical protein